jgi:hypothetical protein
MKRPNFLQGVGVAAVLALLGSVAVTVLTPLVAFSALYSLLIPALALAYVLYILTCSNERVGHATTLTLWAAMSLTVWLAEPPFGLYLMVHVGALWLIRSLYFYSSALSALMDLGLNIASAATAYWAAVHSGSVFLAIWCFFLVQALFIAIPASLHRQSRSRAAAHPDTENFERARLRAEAAIRQLFAQ